MVFVAPWLGFPDGMATSIRVRLVARGLVEAGARAHILCMQPSERPPMIVNRETSGEWHGVTFEYTCGTTVRHSAFLVRRIVELRGWLQGAVRLAQLRRAGRLDCVYLLSMYSYLRRMAVVGFLRLLNVPIVMELNEIPWLQHEAPTFAQRLLSPLAGMDGVVSISSYLTRWAQSEARRRRVPVCIIEVPVLVDMAEHGGSRRPATRDPVVLFAGSPANDQTVEFIVEAMRYVWLRFPTCRLDISGTRPGDPTAQALAEKVAQGSGGDERVRLTGYLPRRDLLRLYRDASALLIPLFDDVRSIARFPSKIGEYLASGRPLVTTSVGEIDRHFVDGENAFVSPPGDVKAYATKICSVLADEGLACAVGSKGRDYARTHFDYCMQAERLNGYFGQFRAASLDTREGSIGQE